MGGECREEPAYPSVLFPGTMIYTKVRRESTCKSYSPPNKAYTGRKASVRRVKSKSVMALRQ